MLNGGQAAPGSQSSMVYRKNTGTWQAAVNFCQLDYMSPLNPEERKSSTFLSKKKDTVVAGHSCCHLSYENSLLALHLADVAQLAHLTRLGTHWGWFYHPHLQRDRREGTFPKSQRSDIDMTLTSAPPWGISKCVQWEIGVFRYLKDHLTWRFLREHFPKVFWRWL